VIVVADAGPLHYLILLGKSDLLPALFGEVIVPSAVRRELMHLHAPTAVMAWIDSPPTWASFVAASQVDQSLPLGDGEREAIAVALELHADLLLVDDKKARRIAQGYGITVAGTLGLMLLAHERRLVDLPAIVGDLRRSGFRVSDKLIHEILNMPLERPADSE
jgi:predicted nucleic acid-binding protein